MNAEGIAVGGAWRIALRRMGFAGADMLSIVFFDTDCLY